MRTTLKLTEIVSEWIAYLDTLATTKADYKRKIALWFRYLSAQGVNPREPNRKQILDYKQSLLAQNKSVFTTDSYVTVVKLFYKFCLERHYYDDIATGIKSSVKQHRHYKHPLSHEQAANLIESINIESMVGKRDKLMIALMLTNGLRACEVERINIEDFDKIGEQTILRIQRKGRVDKREVVALPAIVEELLEDYLADRTFEMSDPLVLNHTNSAKGQRLNKATISRIVKQRMKSIGINDPKITAHSLRHTCGTFLVESGVSVDMIRDILGHSNSSTTRIYIDMAQQRKLISENPSRIIERIIKRTKKEE